MASVSVDLFEILTATTQIAKAVEAEVARRLEEKEKERLEKAAMSPGSGRHKSKSPKKEAHSLPPGILTPLLKRHKDLDNELHARLKELEKKLFVLSSFGEVYSSYVAQFSESGKGEMALAETLSPAARKKTGRAYVALARAHSDQCVASFPRHYNSLILWVTAGVISRQHWSCIAERKHTYRIIRN